jgi:hypothetical protein
MMHRRVTQVLLVAALILTAINLAQLDWLYATLSALGAISAGQHLRIDRLQDEITILRIDKLLDREDSPGDGAP